MKRVQMAVGVLAATATGIVVLSAGITIALAAATLTFLPSSGRGQLWAGYAIGVPAVGATLSNVRTAVPDANAWVAIGYLSAKSAVGEQAGRFYGILHTASSGSKHSGLFPLAAHS